MRYTEKYINKFGRNIKIYNSAGELVQELNCLIQPLRYKNKMYMQGTPTDIGYDHSGYCLLIAPASFDTSSMGTDGYLTEGNKQYHIDRMDEIYFGSEIFYIWAVLREKKSDSYPEYNHFR